MKAGARFPALGLSVALAGLGCSVYDSSLIAGDGAAGSTGSGGTNGSGGSPTEGGATGGAAGAGGGTGELCLGAPRAWYPPKPTAAEVPDGGDDITFVNAMYTIDLGDREPGATTPTEYRTIGLDLDGYCTTEDDPELGECAPPAWAIGSIDGPGGIDNAVGSIIQAVRDRVDGFGSDNYTLRLRNGGVNLLYRVSGYNGTPNDDQVRLETFTAVAITALNPDAGAPKWDGTDRWDVAGDSLGPGGLSDPKYVDDRAYVKDGRLVATLTATLRLEVGFSIVDVVKLNMQLTPSALVCDLREIAPDAGALGTDRWEMSCTLAGRWDTNHLLRQTSQFPDPLNPGAPLCTSSTSYTALKPVICRPTDVYVGMLFPSAICNALSIGVHFDTKPGRIGDVYPLSEPMERCPVGSQPSDDTCETLAPIGSGGTGGTAGAGGTGGRGGGGSAGDGGTAGSATDAGDASSGAP